MRRVAPPTVTEAISKNEFNGKAIIIIMGGLPVFSLERAAVSFEFGSL